MKCEEIESMMVDYLDNTLDQTQKNEIEKHLETCERCLEELKDFREILDKVGSEKMEQPDETLRINFYHMLHGEMNRLAMEKTRPVTKTFSLGRFSRFLRIAAGLALFVTGSLSGIIFNSVRTGSGNKAELAELRTGMDNMREMVMLSMLKEESASQRIQAVSFSDGLREPDDRVLEALATTLNHDRNVNVRIAAAYSLSRFASRQSIRDTLVASLGKQTEPIIQVILMNILVDMKEPKAVQPMQRIMTDDKTLKEVRYIAEKGISVLM